MKERIVMLSDDTHMRTQLNKLLDSPCDFFRSPDEFFSDQGQYSAGNTIIVLDDRFQARESSRICYKAQQIWPGIRMIMLLRRDEGIPDMPLGHGPFVYLPKPVSEKSLHKAFSMLLIDSNDEKSVVLDKQESLLIGDSKCMQNLRSQIRRAAAALSNTIITGETGSGKEMAVKDIQNYTGRKLVAVNCSSLNGNLAESDLFGHRNGSFTGSTWERGGFIKQADGGILFLDEIENLSPLSQASLLRFLDSGEYRSLGEDSLKKADVTVIAATNEPVDRLLAEGRIRKDFYMRLAVCKISIPPLREHLEDIPSLVRHKEKHMGYRTHIKEMSAAYSHTWSGNVRELFNVVMRSHQHNPEEPSITQEMIIDN